MIIDIILLAVIVAAIVYVLRVDHKARTCDYCGGSVEHYGAALCRRCLEDVQRD